MATAAIPVHGPAEHCSPYEEDTSRFRTPSSRFTGAILQSGVSMCHVGRVGSNERVTSLAVGQSARVQRRGERGVSTCPQTLYDGAHWARRSGGWRLEASQRAMRRSLRS